jgi:hypothetical protein
MRKKYAHFEQVPVAVVEKILQMQEPLVKQNGNRKRAVKKTGRAGNRPQVVHKKVEVLTP